MEILDILIGPVYITMAYLFLYLFRAKFTTSYTAPYFIPAFTAKVIGFIAFAFIYQFYYGGGDTFNYFRGSKILTDTFYQNPFIGFQVFFLESGNFDSPLSEYVKHITLFRSPEAWGVIKMGAIASIFSFKSYLGVCVFFSLFCFTGMWQLFSLFAKKYPEITKSLAITMLFAPSTIFWGSALMKDTIALGAVCWLVTSVIRVFTSKKRLLSNLLVILMTTYILIIIKVYLLLSLAPAIAIWWLIRVQKKIRLLSIKIILFPIMLILISGVAYIGVIGAASQSATFANIGAIGEKIQGFHTDHGIRKSGSTYTLGEIDYTPIGLLSKVPASIRVSLFQPFPWEVQNIVMLLSSVESSIYLFLVCYILFKRGIKNFIAPIISHPEIALCVTFTLILAFIIGFTSFNYGALVRFKIPFLPFFGASLVLLYYLPKYKEREIWEQQLNENS